MVVMHRFLSTILPLIFLISNLIATTGANGLQLKIKPGDWIEYEIVWESYPPWPYPVRVRREILSVSGTKITVNITQQFSNGTIRFGIREGDVLYGNGSASLIFVPPNLKKGDVIYVDGFGNFTIKDEIIQNYLGFDRTVVVAYEHIKDMYILVYWDKETGVALEIFNSNGFSLTTKVVGTSLFSNSPANFSAYFVIILLISFTFWVILFTYVREKRLNQKRRFVKTKERLYDPKIFNLLGSGMQHIFPFRSP